MFWLAPLAAVATAVPAKGQAPDLLVSALFEICPELLHGTDLTSDPAKLAKSGFRYGHTTDGQHAIAPLESVDLLIQTDNLSQGSCSVFILGTTSANRQERLLAALRTRNLTIKTMPSPVGGLVINATDPNSGKLVTTSQVSETSLLTLVTGA